MAWHSCALDYITTIAASAAAPHFPTLLLLLWYLLLVTPRQHNQDWIAARFHGLIKFHCGIIAV